MNALIPIDLFEDLSKSGRLHETLTRLADRTEPVIDGDEFALEIAADRIARARKAASLTRAELANRLKLPQSQISRIERNPDRTTIRTLKRIAKALGVDVSALVSSHWQRQGLAHYVVHEGRP
jgi:ribosome-binding protein aMBF1 (putative translation factor)